MYRITLLVLLARIIFGMTIQHHHRMQTEVLSRQSRSDGDGTPPTEAGYVYRQSGDNPELFSWTTSHTEQPYNIGPTYRATENSRLIGTHSRYPFSISTKTPKSETSLPYITPVTSYDSQYELSRLKSDARYESMKRVPRGHNMIDNLQSIMYYTPPADSGHSTGDSFSGYDNSIDFHNDYDDIRSSGKSMYDNYWPYFYHNPYEYEEKFKDKRYASATKRKFIPVHENPENDKIPTSTIEPDPAHNNPISGNGPFFSFMLNDYGNNLGSDEDPLTFKGLEAGWGKELFANEHWERDNQIKREGDFYATEVDSNSQAKGTNHPRNIYPAKHNYPNSHDQSLNSILSSESATQKGNRMKHEHNNHNIGEKRDSNHKTGYDNAHHSYEGFKDFLDAFSNKFGIGDEKKASKYEHKINKDKGEKKKGFHRVYHKDEFQEDKEFFDNTDSNVKAEETGSANAHIGASEALLRSRALANLRNVANAAMNSGNTKNKKYGNFDKGTDERDSSENSLHKYIDVAKQVVNRNNVDYQDTTFRIRPKHI